MKGHRFKTAGETKRWLEKIQHVVSWEENVADAPTFVETRADYPIQFKLPTEINLYGPMTVSISVTGNFVLELPKQRQRQIERFASSTGGMRLGIEYFHRETKFPPKLGLVIRDKQLWVQFETGLSSRDVEARCSVLKEVFDEFGIAVEIKRVTEVKNPWNPKKTIPLTVFGLTDGFQLNPGPGVELKQEGCDANGAASPEAVEFKCDARSPFEILEKFTRIIQRRQWRMGKAHLIFQAEGEKFKDHPERTAQLVKLLNEAAFPTQRVDLELWYTLRRWQDFPLLQKVAAMDKEKSPAEINIWRIDLGQGLLGFIDISATKNTFTASAFPTDPVGNDREQAGRFYAEWKKRLAQIN
jgi:hypothetical protein